MNGTSESSLKKLLEVASLAQRQVVVLNVINLTLMIVNIITNALVIYILIATKQITNIIFKLIFILSVSDLLTGIFVQSLFTTILYKQSCIIKVTYMFITIFLFHLSMYTITIIGIDRYLRIRHYANFKVLWTKRVVFTLLSIGSFLALFQSIMTTTGLLLRKHNFVVPIYFAIDGLILSAIMFLQILTIRTSNAVKNESTIFGSRRVTRKLTKISMQMILLLCFFVAPHQIMTVLHDIIQEKPSHNGSPVLDFFVLISYEFAFANSSANAILFLMTNVKAQRFFRSFRRK